jgi:hypothetical protein
MVLNSALTMTYLISPNRDILFTYSLTVNQIVIQYRYKNKELIGICSSLCLQGSVLFLNL